MRIVRWAAVGVMLAVGLGAFYMGSGGLGSGVAATPGVLTAAATVTTISQDVAATGTVQSADTYALTFGVPAVAGSGGTGPTASGDGTWQVTSVDVAVGDAVATGQELARADTTDLEAKLSKAQTDLQSAQVGLAQAQDTLDSAKSDVRQQLTAAQQKVEAARLGLRNAQTTLSNVSGAAAKRGARISVLNAKTQLSDAQSSASGLRDQLSSDLPDQTKAVLTAQSSVTDLQSQMSTLQDQIDHAVLVAPADGIITEVNVAPGFTAPASNAIVLAGTGLEVVADVVESDLPTVSAGQAATVTITAVGGDEAGTVTSVAPTTTAESGSVVTYPVTVTLDAPAAGVRPGMSANVSISVATAADAVAVPVSALRGSAGDYSVEVLGADGSLARRPVQVGLVTETLAQVTSGLNAGEQVVTGSNTQRTQTTTGTGFPGGGGGLGGPGLPGGGGFFVRDGR